MMLPPMLTIAALQTTYAGGLTPLGVVEEASAAAMHWLTGRCSSPGHRHPWSVRLRRGHI